MYELTSQDKEYILEKMKLSIGIITDCDHNMGEKRAKIFDTQNDRYERYKRYTAQMVNLTGYVQCYCKAGKGVPQHGHLVCPHCGRESVMLLTDSKSKALKNDFEEYRVGCDRRLEFEVLNTSYKTHVLFYVKNMPDVDGGIIIYKLKVSAKAPKDEKEQLTLSWSVLGVVEIIPGVSCKGYKISRKVEVPEDIFSILNINSTLLKFPPNIIFEGSRSSVEFVLNNKKFNQYTAYMELFNLMQVNLPQNSFFMMYMYLYAAYPSVELVVKMGMYQFAARMLHKMASEPNKDAIREMANSFTKLLNPKATNGAQIFNLPKYVIEDCLQRKASWEEMLAWQDIFEMDKTGKIGKEQYLYVTRHQEYFHYKNTQYRNLVCVLADIMVFGYAPQESLNYLHKQRLKYDYDTKHIREWLLDYLRMCDLMGVEPDKYPQDVHAVHENMTESFYAREDEVNDRIIDRIATLAERYVPIVQESEYCIQLPHDCRDVIQEGQNMRNCVGSYLRRIADRDSLVFFIRRKETPEESFITAEYRDGIITQLYFKNNRRVDEPELVQLANMYAYNLHRGRFESQRI